MSAHWAAIDIVQAISRRRRSGFCNTRRSACSEALSCGPISFTARRQVGVRPPTSLLRLVAEDRVRTGARSRGTRAVHSNCGQNCGQSRVGVPLYGRSHRNNSATAVDSRTSPTTNRTKPTRLAPIAKPTPNFSPDHTEKSTDIRAVSKSGGGKSITGSGPRPTPVWNGEPHFAQYVALAGRSVEQVWQRTELIVEL